MQYTVSKDNLNVDEFEVLRYLGYKREMIKEEDISLAKKHIEKAREIYRIMGKKFLQKPHHSYTVISPDEEFEKCFDRVADKKRKLYNGMIKCDVFMYYKGVDG